MLDKITLPLWPFPNERPPRWVVEAFHRMGAFTKGETRYTRVAKNVAANAIHFKHTCVPALERALQGSEGSTTALFPITPDEQRIRFFELAIKDAYFFRPGSSPLGRNGNRAFDVLEERRRLDKVLIKHLRALNIALIEHQRMSDSLGIEGLSCDPLDLIRASDRASPIESKRPGDYLLRAPELFEELAITLGPQRAPAFLLAGMASILADRISNANAQALLSPQEKLGIKCRSSIGHFISALGIHVTQESFSNGGCLPDNFDPSHTVLAALEGCMLGTGSMTPESRHSRDARARARGADVQIEAEKNLDRAISALRDQATIPTRKAG